MPTALDVCPAKRVECLRLKFDSGSVSIKALWIFVRPYLSNVVAVFCKIAYYQFVRSFSVNTGVGIREPPLKCGCLSV